MFMRWFVPSLMCCGLLALVGCTASRANDGSVTNDSNEINEGRGALEREINPPLSAPTSPLIGADMTAVFDEVKAEAGTQLEPVKQNDGCVRTEFKNPTTKKISAERVKCRSSDTIRVYASGGDIKAEHADLNGDGKVDRFTSQTEAVAQYLDTNFDGEIDTIVERVDELKDFSMEGYDETFPKTKFLFRIREDRNHDGKLDFEKLTARGALPQKAE
jgi:hypothetical protein